MLLNPRVKQFGFDRHRGMIITFGEISYLLRDDFTDTRAAGAVNGTPATPGPGTRVVVDTNSKLSIGSGVVSFSTGGVANGNPGLWYGVFTRLLGRILVGSVVNNSGVQNGASIGWDVNQTGGISETANFLANGVLSLTGTTYNVIVGTFTDGVSYRVALVLRATGQYFFIKGGTQYPNWTLVWFTAATGNNMFPSVNAVGVASVFTCDYIRIPDALFIPAPLAYDTFTRANGALGNTQTTGPDGQVATARAWADSVGTWAIATNVAACSALAGGIGIATYDCGKLDVLHDAALTRSAGNIGTVIRYADANNYIIGYHDGTNFKADKVVAGSVTNVISAAATYAAGAVGRLIMEGTKIRAFYNNAAVGSEGTISDAGLQTGTRVGLYTTDTGNTIDNVTTWARGTGGEYAQLDNY